MQHVYNILLIILSLIGGYLCIIAGHKYAEIRENISWITMLIFIPAFSAWAFFVINQYNILIGVVYLLLGGLFLFGSYVDIQRYILPDRVTLGGLVIVWLLRIWLAWSSDAFYSTIMPTLLGSLLGGCSFLIIQRIYRWLRGTEGLGTGDVKLMFCIGALVGPSPLGVSTVILIAALTAMLFVALYKFKGDSINRVPFGPFLCLGTMIQIVI